MLTPRNPDALAREHFDVIIVGGGIYGSMLALEAVQHGLRPLLIERHDFGAATSFNSLRIVHGGLRYLQDFDFRQFRDTVAERRWFLRTFPNLVRPLPCLAPLYGYGLHSPPVYRLALHLNDALSADRNTDLPVSHAIPAGRVADAAEVRKIFPEAEQAALRGGAVWHDALISDTPRLIIDVLRWACAGGAAVLNYTTADRLILTGDQVTGIEAIDQVSGQKLRFHAATVINAAGPWNRELASRFGRLDETLYTPSLAWNVVFRRPALSDHALAVRSKRRGSHMYFLVPWKGMLFAGTGHEVWNGGPDDGRPSSRQLEHFIADLNDAVPSLRLGLDDVARIMAGLLPAVRQGSRKLLRRAAVIDHAAHGGPVGLISICGVKFTLARRVAETVIAHAFPSAKGQGIVGNGPPAAKSIHPSYAFSWMPSTADNDWKAPLRQAIETEAVHHLDDLLLRRSALGDNPERARMLAPQVCDLFEWNEARSAREIETLMRAI